MTNQLLRRIQEGDIKAIARSISLIENEVPGYDALLMALPASSKKIIGITGPPGAGKSTLVDGLIGLMVKHGHRVAVLCVDPSSPFSYGALLGDRIRMNEWYNHPDVYIRSLATRGSLGGLHPGIIEISDLLKAAPYDHIIIETVGVGQSEIEIAGLADTTVVVVMPEAGDEVQTMKAGLMEIADLFVVNKADRPDADMFVRNLRAMIPPAFGDRDHPVAVVKAIATRHEGIEDVLANILLHQKVDTSLQKKAGLLADKAYHIMQHARMKGTDKKKMLDEILAALHQGGFNLYRYVSGIN